MIIKNTNEYDALKLEACDDYHLENLTDFIAVTFNILIIFKDTKIKIVTSASKILAWIICQ